MSNKTRLTKDGRKCRSFLRSTATMLDGNMPDILFTRKMVSHIRQASEITNR